MDKRLLALLAIVVFLGSISLPLDLNAIEINHTGFGTKHFAGGRAGAWVMISDEKTSTDEHSVDFAGSVLYVEFFYAHRFSSLLSGEVSFGLFSQGDIEYESGSGTIYGEGRVYPFFLSGKIYPLGRVHGMPFHPYLRLGGGLVYGTRDITNPSDYYSSMNDFVEETQAKITYLAGLGIDWPVADQICLDIDCKYIPVEFGKALAGFRDYSGWVLTVGVGYTWKAKK